MSPSGRTEHVAFLRAAIARIESGMPAAVRPATGAAPGRGEARSARLSSRRRATAPRRAPFPLGPEGFPLDRLLGGGLRPGALHEVVPASARDEGAASGFALAVAARCLHRRGVLIWIVEDCAATESGAPYRPGLQAHGIDPDRLIVVRTRGAQATLWAAEEALRLGDVFVLCELWGGKLYGLTPSRRLVLAARSHGATGLVLHAGLAGGARALSSSSETRFVVAARPSRMVAAVNGSLPVPGEAAFALRLDKARAAAGDVDPHRIYSLLWNAEQRCFYDPDCPVAVASPPADRPAQAERRPGFG